MLASTACSGASAPCICLHSPLLCFALNSPQTALPLPPLPHEQQRSRPSHGQVVVKLHTKTSLLETRAHCALLKPLLLRVQERSRLGNHQTVAELHAMISSLKTVIELKEQEARLAKVGALDPGFFEAVLVGEKMNG
eukprot:scaffold5293_cov20-Tisochrysis_lutea.AAC.1